MTILTRPDQHTSVGPRMTPEASVALDEEVAAYRRSLIASAERERKHETLVVEDVLRARSALRPATSPRSQRADRLHDLSLVMFGNSLPPLFQTGWAWAFGDRVVLALVVFGIASLMAAVTTFLVARRLSREGRRT